MKKLPALLFAFLWLTGAAQPKYQPTNAFTVTGKVKKPLTFTLADIQKLPAKNLPDVLITNHLGEPRGTARQLQGVLVKDILIHMELDEDNPKFFSEFYFVFTAIDQYKVVYSWNEIFNSATGDNLYLITARDGKKLDEMDERILILTPTDFKTGRRHIKGLSTIEVKRAE